MPPRSHERPAHQGVRTRASVPGRRWHPREQPAQMGRTCVLLDAPVQELSRGGLPGRHWYTPATARRVRSGGGAELLGETNSLRRSRRLPAAAWSTESTVLRQARGPGDRWRHLNRRLSDTDTWPRASPGWCSAAATGTGRPRFRAGRHAMSFGTCSNGCGPAGRRSGHRAGCLIGIDEGPAAAWLAHTAGSGASPARRSGHRRPNAAEPAFRPTAGGEAIDRFYTADVFLQT